MIMLFDVGGRCCRDFENITNHILTISENSSLPSHNFTNVLSENISRKDKTETFLFTSLVVTANFQWYLCPLTWDQ